MSTFFFFCIFLFSILPLSPPFIAITSPQLLTHKIHFNQHPCVLYMCTSSLVYCHGLLFLFTLFICVDQTMRMRWKRVLRCLCIYCWSVYSAISLKCLNKLINNLPIGQIKFLYIKFGQCGLFICFSTFLFIVFFPYFHFRSILNRSSTKSKTDLAHTFCANTTI